MACQDGDLTRRCDITLMKVMLSLIALTGVLGLGCAQVVPPVRISAPLDLTAAQQGLATGPNTIAGSALIRQAGGGIVTCAGADVSLIPATEYATQRMLAIYGSDQSGYRPARMGRLQFDPDLPAYWETTRRVVGDAQGAFEFDHVADGSFFVATSITWLVGRSVEGGSLMQRVTVIGGERKRVVLSPHGNN